MRAIYGPLPFSLGIHAEVGSAEVLRSARFIGLTLEALAILVGEVAAWLSRGPEAS